MAAAGASRGGEDKVAKDQMELLAKDIKLFLLFRRIFDKLPDKATHEAALVEMSSDLMQVVLQEPVGTQDD